VHYENIIAGLIILIVFGCNTSKLSANKKLDSIDNHDYMRGSSNGVLDSEQIQFLKQNYNWKSEKNLIINFKESESNCKSAVYILGTDGFKKEQKIQTAFYSKINLDNYLNIFIYSEIKGIERFIDNKTYFNDINNELLNSIFHNKTVCYGKVILNQNGKFVSFSGPHFSKKRLEAYLDFVNRETCIINYT
jgi:hypothetical protein